jgi:hypothetical protein
MYIWTFYVHSQKFVEKKTFFVTYVKKIKAFHVKNYFESSKIVLFTHPMKNVISLWNLVCKHRMLRCTPRIYFRIFRHFKIYFLDNGCIYTYEPKMISRDVLLSMFSPACFTFVSVLQATELWLLLECRIAYCTCICSSFIVFYFLNVDLVFLLAGDTNAGKV